MAAVLASCSPSQPTTPPQVPATVRTNRTPDPTSASLARNWIATGITFNGVADPNFDPSKRVDFVVNSDGSYRMSSASSSTEGTWQVEHQTELLLVDAQVGGVQRFGIDTLTTTRLALRLLDETKAQVVLHYRAE